MVKLASARDFRTYGPGLAKNRCEYINAGLYLIASVVLVSGLVAQLSSLARSGLVLIIAALGIILLVNLHDFFAHLVGIDFRLPLMAFDLQLAFVEFAVPVIQMLGTLLTFLGVFFLFIQEEKGYGYFKLEKHALNMLVAGPVLWVIGSIHNSCQIYERADGHVQILQQCVNVPFLMGSLSFMLSAILNYHEKSKDIHHGLHLLSGTWIWLGIFGSLMFFIGGLTNLIKVFKMQQMNGIRLEKLRGGAHERLLSARERQIPLIMEHQTNISHQPQETKVTSPLPTPYKDVLIARKGLVFARGAKNNTLVDNGFMMGYLIVKWVLYSKGLQTFWFFLTDFGLSFEMASVSSQPQFRYTQPPSKVLHLRNLPWECTEEELIELGKPFGKVVNTKCNVGANRNQAFIEFADLNQAIAMISYYASSSEPAQVRGKTVYLQYSNRQEIVNNKTTADVPGNVLLVTIEGADARLVSIDVLHLVFSAFGFVHKITTFEKTAGFQALVQFSDAETATSAKDALDGRSIPRDYTNPYLPVAPSAVEGSGQAMVGLDGKRLETESNVLLASIENMQYAVTLDVLHMVFSAFGPVQKIAMFDKNGGLQALIQYPDTQTAVVAKEALEGHCIYDGGFCKLHLSYSRHTDLSIKVNNDRSRDYTIPNTPIVNAQPSIFGQQSVSMMGPSQQPFYGSQAGWGTAPPAAVQSMPMQMHNNVYMPPGTMPQQMAPGMQFPSHNTAQPTTTMPSYGSDRTQ
ncbi:Polypyrimidine tract-binding 2 [Glycine soja]